MLGTYPANIIPNKITFHSCWIWNTDENSEEGKHWIPIWLSKEKMYFFDSFGKTAHYYNRVYWENLAKQLNVELIKVQKNQIQSKRTYVCGV